jgi:hypothetical protein
MYSSTSYHIFTQLVCRSWLLLNKRWETESIAVAEEHDALILALGALVWLNPLAPSGALPQAMEEAPRAALDVRAVVLAHHWLDGLRGLVGVVEGDGADIVMENVGLDDAVEELAADETEFAIDSSGGSTDIVPGLVGVMRKRWIGMLEVSDGNFVQVSFDE